MSVVCDLRPRIVEVQLPDGSSVTFGCCPLCGFTPDELVMGVRKKVRGDWLLPGHDVSEDELERQFGCNEVMTAIHGSAQ